MMNSLKSSCFAEPCIINEKTKEREKRTVSCNSPGCQKVFHATCIGHGRTSDKELNNLFFECLKCGTFLNYSAEIARKSFMTDFDNKLQDLRTSIDKALDEKIRLESDRIMHETRKLCEAVAKQCDEKITYIQKQVTDVDALRSEFQSLKLSLMKDTDNLTNTCGSMQSHIRALELEKRKSSFIVRNFPEKNVTIKDKNITNCGEAIAMIAEELCISDDSVRQIKDVFRLGKVNRTDNSDNKPRLIMVRASEKVAKQFLVKSKLLKHSDSLLSKVFIQENLPPEINKKLFDMRKRAYEHRSNNPGESAYVKNKKLYINGAVVEEINQVF